MIRCCSAISATLTSTSTTLAGPIECSSAGSRPTPRAASHRSMLMTEGNKRVLGGRADRPRHIAQDPAQLIMSSTDYSPCSTRAARSARACGGKRKDSGYQLQRLRSGLYQRQVETDSRAALPSLNSGWPMPRASRSCAASGTRSSSRFSVLAKDGAGWRRLLEAEGSTATPISTGLADNDSAVLVVGQQWRSRIQQLWSVPLDGTAAKKMIRGAGTRCRGRDLRTRSMTPC